MRQADRQVGETKVVGGGLYEVTLANRTYRSMINRRREMISPIEEFDTAQHQAAMRDFFPRVGLEDYADSVVAEMFSRPIVEAAYPGEHAAIRDAYERVFPLLLRWLLKRTRRKPSSFKNESRVGAPYVGRLDSKRDELMPQFLDAVHSTEAEARRFTDNGWNMINVRLQPERVGRVRDMTFISGDGEVYRAKIGVDERRVTNREKTVSGIAQRTRDIFMPHKANLATLFVDNALHEPELDSRLCGTNMFGQSDTIIPRGAQATLFTDIRHMDRYTGECVRFRAACIGGIYEMWINAMLDQPYLVPSDGWTNAWWVRVLGNSQLPSGLSPVAPIQKELMICLYTVCLSERRGIDLERALELIMHGGDGAFTVRNYGDDNALAGDRSELDYWMAFASERMAIEEEKPPKFLGFEYDEKDGRFKLTAKSYCLKTWLNERPPASMWRKNAHYGWVRRREAYMQYGDVEEMQRIYDIENEVLAAHGVPWADIETAAAEEEAEFGSDAIGFGTLDKEWLLSAEERARLPGYELVDEQTATEMTRMMVGPEVRAQLFPANVAERALVE